MDEQTDKALTCVECGATFIFSTGEQNYFKERNLSTPKRCAACRVAKREARARQANEESLSGSGA